MPGAEMAPSSSVIILISIGPTIKPMLDGKGVDYVEDISILDIGVAERQQGCTDKPLAGGFGTLLEHIVMQFDI